MKVVAYTPLLYGAEYLAWAIRSVIDAVDEYWVLYAPTGSHNGNKPVELPEGEDARTLYEIAQDAAGRKLRWYTHVGWSTEGEQRDTIFKLAPDADRIIALDYDEVWSPGLVEAAVRTSASRPDVRNWRVPMIHLWKDFYHAILHDPAYPIRVINPRAADGETTFDAEAHDAAKRELLTRTMEYVPEFHSRIVHAGYAISPELMRAKWSGTHGHQNELRKDIDWFTERYENPKATRDLHPVGSEWWNAEPIEPFVYLPQYMADHPRMAERAAA